MIYLVLSVISLYMLAMEWMLYRRLFRKPGRLRRRILFWSLVAVPHVYLLMLILIPPSFRAFPVESVKPVYFAILAWAYTVILYLPVYFLSLLLLKIWFPRNAGKKSSARRQALGEIIHRAADAMPFVIGGTMLSGMFLGSREFAILERELRLPVHEHLRGLRIIQISDIHVGNLIHEKYLAAAAGIIRSVPADMLIVTGDIMDNNNAFLPIAGGFFRSVTSHFPLGSYAILGNHDFIMNGDQVARELSGAGLKFLRNEQVTISRGRGKLFLNGIDDPWAFGRDRTRENVLKFLGKSLSESDDHPRLLLDHNPVHFSYLKDHPRRIDQVFSGHTHGGQIIPGGDRDSPLAVASHFLEFFADAYERNGRGLYVNRGLGHWFPLRIGCPPEITRFTLV